MFIANLSILFIPTADSMASPSDTKNLGDVSGLVAVVTGGIYIFFDEQSRYRIRQRRADTSRRWYRNWFDHRQGSGSQWSQKSLHHRKKTR